MFGGIMIYAECKPFASLSDLGPARKVAAGVHAAGLGMRALQRCAMHRASPEARVTW